jgi:WD40 repeat protein
MNPPKKLREVPTDRQLRMVRFRQDGKVLFGAGFDSDIRRWDFSPEEPTALPPLAGHRGWVEAIALAPAHGLLYSIDSWGQLSAWSMNDEMPAVRWKHETAHDGWIRTVVVSDDQQLLVTAGRDKIARVWNAADGKLLHELKGHEHEIFCAAVHPDSNSLVTGDWLGHLKVWELPSGECKRQARLEKMHFHDRDEDVSGLHLLQFRDEGKTLICAGCDPMSISQGQGVPSIRTLNWENLETTRTLTLGDNNQGMVFDLAWNSDGAFLAVTSGTPGAGRFIVRKLEEEKPLFESSELANCHSLAIHAQSKRVVIASTNRDSNGNGAVLDKDGKYRGNTSPLTVFELS